jgi:hypothetical protein
MLERLAEPGLHYLPDLAICMLLKAAVGDERPEHSHLESPVRKLSDWVTEPAGGGQRASERRECLLDATIKWAEEGGDIATCWLVLPKCVSLRMAGASIDPVDDRKFILQHGIVPETEQSSVSDLWDRIVAFARVHPPESWAPLVGAFHDWLYPGSIVPDVSLPGGFQKYAREKAEKVLSELASVPGCPRNALARWAQERADVLAELVQRLVPDEEFVTVFPSDPTRASRDLQSQFEERVGLAQALGRAWVTEKPEEVATRLNGFAHEVRTLGSRVWPDLRSAACAALASSVDDITPWVESFMAASLDVECVAPLLEHAARTGHPEAASWLVAALSHPPYQFRAAETILAHGDLPSSTTDAIVDVLSRRPDLVRTQALRGEIATRWFPRLASHPSADVLRSLVLGDFESEAKPFLSADRDRWLDVFRRGVAGLEELHPNEFYHLDQILGQFPELAVAIARALLRNAKSLLCEHNPCYSKLTAVLSSEDRMQLLPLLQDFAPGEFTSLLVGGDLAVYEALLQKPELKRHHLSPLMSRPFDDTWKEKARMAVSHGHSPEDVASAPFTSGWSFWGNAIGFWEGWRREFEELAVLLDELLNRIGEAGIERCDCEIARASQAERHEEIYGISGDE